MRYRHVFSLIALLLFVMISCEPNAPKGSEKPTSSDSTKVNPKTTGSIRRMAITDATAIMIALSDKPVGAKAPCKEQAQDETESDTLLYKITDDGSVELVLCTDANGDTIDFRPTHIFTVEGTPYFFCYVKSTKDFFLVNSETGKVYDANAIEWDKETIDYGGDFDIQTDNNGYLYCLYNAGNVRLFRVKVTEADSLVATDLTPETEWDDVYQYVVSDDGDFFLSGCDQNRCGTKLRSKDGVFYPFTIIPRYGHKGEGLVFKGLDGKLHVWDSYCLQVVSFENGDLQLDTVYNAPEDTYFRVLTYPRYAITNNRIFCVCDDEFVIIDSNNPQELGNIYTPFSKSAQILGYENTENYIYCTVRENYIRNVIYRIDLNTFEPTLIYNDPNYEIFTFTVQGNDVILFNALRYSDGIKVLASVDTEGNMQILDEELNPTVTVLQRLQ